MDMYVKCGSMEEAQIVFSRIPVKDVVLVESHDWRLFFKKNCLHEVLKHFVEMQKESRPNGIIVACILPACGSLVALEIGREIHGHE